MKAAESESLAVSSQGGEAKLAAASRLERREERLLHVSQTLHFHAHFFSCNEPAQVLSPWEEGLGKYLGVQLPAKAGIQTEPDQP